MSKFEAATKGLIKSKCFALPPGTEPTPERNLCEVLRSTVASMSGLSALPQNVHKGVEGATNLAKQIKTACVDMFWYVLICFDMFWYVLICFDMSWYVLICFVLAFFCWWLRAHHSFSLQQIATSGMSPSEGMDKAAIACCYACTLYADTRKRSCTAKLYTRGKQDITMIAYPSASCVRVATCLSLSPHASMVEGLWETHKSDVSDDI